MQNLKNNLQKDKEIKILIQDENELMIEVKNNKIIDIAKLLLKENFITLLTITAIDLDEKIKLIYRFGNIENGEFVNLQTFVNKNENIESLSEIFKSSNWLEREVYDLFGVKFLNHPNLTRILNPEDFKGFPLLKKPGTTIGENKKKNSNPNQLTFF